MVATVQIGEKHGTAGTFTDKTSGTIRFKNADNATVDTVNPMLVPTAGVDWSYEKWLRLKVTVAPSVQISNLQVYTNDNTATAMGTGITGYGKIIATYATPSHPTTTGTGWSDLFTGFSSTTPGDIGTGTYTGTGEKGSHFVCKIKVATTASQGDTGSNTITFSYDEI